MASAYPGALDSFATNKANATSTPTDHPNHHNDLADAVNKIEAELGVTPSGDSATVAARLDQSARFWSAATESVYDDYFDSDQSADWTAVAIAGTSEWNYRHQSRLGPNNRGLLASFEDQAAGDWPAYLKPLSGIAQGDYIQSSISILRYTTGIAMPLLAFSDGVLGTSAMVGFGPEINATPSAALVTVEGTLENATVFDLNLAVGERINWATSIHYRMEWNAANTFICSWSLNGEDWVALHTLTATLTPTHGGFAATSYGASTRNQGLFRYFHSNVTP